MKILILFLGLGFFNFGQAWELEAIPGVTVIQFDEEDYQDYNTAGASARFKANFYNGNKGVWLHNLWRGQSVAAFDAILGYSYRSSGSWYFEAGAGLAYGVASGVGAGALLGTGFKASGNWYVSVPAIIKSGGWSYLLVTPMIGYKF
ncbi:hypothetical protein N9N67_00840 [Bacteriovoracaceae bacterium]|nr:hypothetical protein [Bacteriovoracaceae bacterium]